MYQGLFSHRIYSLHVPNIDICNFGALIRFFFLFFFSPKYCDRCFCVGCAKRMLMTYLLHLCLFSRAMSSAATTPPSVDKVDGFSRKSVRKAKQKRSQSSSQFRSQGKPIELTPLPLLKGDSLMITKCSHNHLISEIRSRK